METAGVREHRGLPVAEVAHATALQWKVAIALKLQDGDPVLARDIASSRKALWNILIDPATFKSP